MLRCVHCSHLPSTYSALMIPSQVSLSLSMMWLNLCQISNIIYYGRCPRTVFRLVDALDDMRKPEMLAGAAF